MNLKLVHVKEYDRNRLEPIYSASRQTLRQVYRLKEHAVFEPLNPLDQSLIIVKDGNLEVGTTRLHYYKDRLHILGLGVLNEYRRKGVCSMIMSYVEKLAREEGLDRITLYTIRETGNVAVFCRYGFEVIEEEETSNFVSDTYKVLHEVFMGKNLKK